MEDREYYSPAIETLDREALRDRQLELLKWQIRRCYDGSDFYHERFKHAGLTPEDIQTLEDIVHIPPVTKQQLREEQVAHPPFGRYTVAPRETWGELHPSTGTTGMPVNTIWSQQDVRTIANWTARTMWNCGVRPGDIVQNGFSYGLWVAGMSTHYATQELHCFALPVGAGLTERHLDYLVNPGSTVLISTPSFSLYIAEMLRQRGVLPDQIPLRIGLFGGEGGVEVAATRKKIEEGLGIDAYDYYGLAEIGPTIASECREKAGLHWVEDHLLIEVIEPETRKPCSEGQAGILVMTHLTKQATPMIRYWTNDIAKLTTTQCACGRTHARSEGGIRGRADDMLIYRGAKFYPVQVEKVVRGMPELSSEFVIELSTHDRLGTDVCTIVVEAGEESAGNETLLQVLKRAFKQELLVTPEVRVEPFGSLERILDLRKK
jgi:phenylacetate-CoA ligase